MSQLFNTSLGKNRYWTKLVIQTHKYLFVQTFLSCILSSPPFKVVHTNRYFSSSTPVQSMYLCVEYKKRCTIQPTGIYILAAYLLSYWFSSRRWEFYNRFVKLFLLIFSILMPIWCPIWKLRILFFPRVIIVSNNRYIYTETHVFTLRLASACIASVARRSIHQLVHTLDITVHHEPSCTAHVCPWLNRVYLYTRNSSQYLIKSTDEKPDIVPPKLATFLSCSRLRFFMSLTSLISFYPRLCSW